MLINTHAAYPLLDTLHNCIPLVTAAVDMHTYTPQEDVLAIRINTVAITTISIIGASIAVGLALFPPALLIGLVAIPLFFVIIACDRRVAENTSDTLAVDHYIKNDIPSINCVDRILRNVSAAKLLLTKTRDITKETESGYRILEPVHLKKDVFKLLVDSKVNVFFLDSTGVPDIVGFEDPSFLKYALQNNPGIAANLSGDIKVRLFQHVRHLESIKTLVNAGFDINSQDARGYTPLLTCVLHANVDQYIIGSNKSGQKYHKVIAALLENGADLEIAVVIKGRQFSASKLNIHPKIDRILKKYTNSPT